MPPPLQINYSDASKEFPDKVFEPHVYAYTGANWRLSYFSSAQDIRDELQTLTGDDRLSAAYIKDLPAAKFERLLNSGPVSGLSITNLGADVIGPATALGSPALDLDDEPAQGELDVVVTFTVATRSASTVGFGSSHGRASRQTQILFKTNLSALAAAYNSATPAANTITVGDAVEVYSGASKTGDLRLRLAKNAANEVLWSVQYDSTAAGAGNCTIGVDLEAAFSPTDAEAVDTGPVVQTLTDAASVAWNLDDGATADLTLAGNRTLAVPTGGADGGWYLLRATQDATGSRTLTLAAGIVRGGLDAPTLSTDANAVDLLMFTRIGTTVRYAGIILGA